MTVIARDTVASDHLVYAWPFPIGPECEVSCADDEQVVMCPAWMVGDRLGPGRHLYRTPDPTRPVGAFFVLTAPVEVGFDMVTMFMLPSTGQPIRLRASGSLQVRCADPGLLVAQFVGLPFDSVNDGVLRSVSRSLERMLARLLTRRVVMAGTPWSVTDPTMLPGIVEELVAYNPTAGAVFGVELIRMGHLVIAADDGQAPYLALPQQDWSGVSHSDAQAQPFNGNGNGHVGGPHDHAAPAGAYPGGAQERSALHLDTIRGMPAISPAPEPPAAPPRRAASHAEPDGQPNLAFGSDVRPPGPPQAVVSGELGGAKKPGPPQSTVSGELGGGTRKKVSTPPPIPSVVAPRHASPMDAPNVEEITQPKQATPVPGAVKAPDKPAEPRGAILGIGMGQIGSTSSTAGEIQKKIPPGGRCLVPGPNGLMQSATVRQLLQGYYELEVGSTGQLIWVPMAGVVPE